MTDPNTELTTPPRTITAMTGTAQRVQTARGHLARFVAVLAVLAAVGFAVVLQCADGMSMPMAHVADPAPVAMDCGTPAAMPASPADDLVMSGHTSRDTAGCAMPGADATAAYAVDTSPGPVGLGGVVATCLALLVAVVAAIAGLRSAGPRTLMVRLRSALVVMAREFRPPSLSLAQLCLSRT